MTPLETAQVRDLIARNRLLEREVWRMKNEIAYLRERGPDTRAARRLTNRVARQKARAEMWKVRALGARR